MVPYRHVHFAVKLPVEECACVYDSMKPNIYKFINVLKILYSQRRFCTCLLQSIVGHPRHVDMTPGRCRCGTVGWWLETRRPDELAVLRIRLFLHHIVSKWCLFTYYKIKIPTCFEKITACSKSWWRCNDVHWFVQSKKKCMRQLVRTNLPIPIRHVNILIQVLYESNNKNQIQQTNVCTWCNGWTDVMP